MSDYVCLYIICLLISFIYSHEQQVEPSVSTTMPKRLRAITDPRPSHSLLAQSASISVGEQDRNSSFEQQYKK